MRAAANFILRRFVGEVDLMDLAFTCETVLELRRMDEMGQARQNTFAGN